MDNPETKPLPDETPEAAARLPVSILFGLRRYGHCHVPVGGFLTAVLANDLFESVCRADEDNYAALRSIVNYVYNCMPSPCHGSREKVAAWTSERVAWEESK
jgi:hypothetical protein